MIRSTNTVLDCYRDEFKLVVKKRGWFQTKFEKVKEYEIAVGREGLETPHGSYAILDKVKNPDYTYPDSDWVPEALRGTTIKGSDPNCPIRSRWMPIYDGAGIHGIPLSEYDSIGSAASHGCIRMRVADVKELYDMVPKGTIISIY